MAELPDTAHASSKRGLANKEGQIQTLLWALRLHVLSPPCEPQSHTEYLGKTVSITSSHARRRVQYPVEAVEDRFCSALGLHHGFSPPSPCRSGFLRPSGGLSNLGAQCVLGLRFLGVTVFGNQIGFHLPVGSTLSPKSNTKSCSIQYIPPKQTTHTTSSRFSIPTSRFAQLPKANLATFWFSNMVYL